MLKKAFGGGFVEQWTGNIPADWPLHKVDVVPSFPLSGRSERRLETREKESRRAGTEKGTWAVRTEERKDGRRNDFPSLKRKR